MKSRNPIILILAIGVLWLDNISAQNLFVSDSSSGSIYEFTPDGTQSTFATGMSDPEGLAFDHAGNLFVANYDDAIYKIALDGTRTTNSTHALYLAIDGADNLYASDRDAGSVNKFSPDGTESTFASGLWGPSGMACDSAGNLFEMSDLLVYTGAPDGYHYYVHSIFKFAPDGTESVFTTNCVYSPGLVFDAAGNLFCSDYSDGNIVKYAPDGTRSTFASGLNYPAGLVFGSAGNLYVADRGSGSIYKYAPDGTRSTFATGLGSPSGLAFFPSPQLKIQLADNHAVQISWPNAAGTNWVLCCQQDLAVTNGWTVVTNSPVLVGANYVVTEPCASTASFYRLEQR